MKKKHAKKWQLEVGFYMLLLCIINYLDTNKYSLIGKCLNCINRQTGILVYVNSKIL